MQDLGLLSEGLWSIAHGVSADGNVIVGDNRTSTGYRGFRWTNATGMQDLGVMSDGVGAKAYGISANGNVIVGENRTSQGYQAFRWTAETGMQGIGYLNGGQYSRAYNISADGNVVIGVSTGAAIPGQRSFRWTAIGGMQEIGIFTGGRSSYALGISADGSVIVGESDSSNGWRAYRWTDAGGMKDLGDMQSGMSSEADGVSPDGTVVVGSIYSNTISQSFIYDTFSNQMQSLQNILLYQNAKGINNWSNLDYSLAITGDWTNGFNIVGKGTINGQQHAFLVTGLTSTVPEPSSWIMGMISASVMTHFTRKQLNQCV